MPRRPQGQNASVGCNLSSAKQAGMCRISLSVPETTVPTNQGALHLYRPLALFDLDSHNYDPNGGTPLYDPRLQTLTGVQRRLPSSSRWCSVSRRDTTTDGADMHPSPRRSVSTTDQRGRTSFKTEQHIIVGEWGSMTMVRPIIEKCSSIWGIPDDSHPGEQRARSDRRLQLSVSPLSLRCIPGCWYPPSVRSVLGGSSERIQG